MTTTDVRTGTASDVGAGTAAAGVGSGAKDMLLTALGELVLRRGRPVWTATLVAILDAHGYSEKNARQAVTRLADQDLLAGERVGRQTRWSLTDRARDILVSGTERIFGFLDGPPPPPDNWLVISFSVPEDRRPVRARLRRELGFLGFGFPAPGVALAAHGEREAAATRVLNRLGIVESCLVFRGGPTAVTGEAELVRRAWDLEALAARYDDFLGRFGPIEVGGPDGRSGPVVPAAAGRRVTDLVHHWRQFPFVDPELPDRLLPHHWPGRPAKALFDRCHRAWLPAALAWVDALEDTVS